MANHFPSGVQRLKEWLCKRCGHTNKALHQSCDRCGHEPTTGRRDVHPEGRRYTPRDED